MKQRLSAATDAYVPASLPHPVWGAGKLDAAAAARRLRPEGLAGGAQDVNLSSNPVRGGALVVNYPEPPRSIAVYTLIAERVRRGTGGAVAPRIGYEITVGAGTASAETHVVTAITRSPGYFVVTLDDATGRGRARNVPVFLARNANCSVGDRRKCVPDSPAGSQKVRAVRARYDQGTV